MKTLKRISISFMVVVLLFVVLDPRNKAHANPLAIPVAAGGYSAVGAYVLGGVIVGGVLTGLGVEYGEEISAHSHAVWNGANDAVKASLKASYDAAIAAGDGIMHLSDEVLDFIKSSTDKMIAYQGMPLTVRGTGFSRIGKLSGDNYNYEIATNTGYAFKAVAASGGYVYGNTIYVRYKEKAVLYNNYPDLTSASVGAAHSAVIASDAAHHWTENVFDYEGNFTAMNNAVGGSFSLVKVSESSKAADLGLWDNKDYIDQTVDQVLAKAKQGVYVPSSDFAAYPVDNYGSRTSDIPLTYNPANPTQPWEMPGAPGVPYTGQTQWDFPMPTYGVDGATGAVTTPTVKTGEGSKVFAGEGAGTVVNTGNPAIPSESTGILERLTTGIVGKPEDVKWDKMKTVGTVFTTKFPFSLPWDAKNAMDSVFGGFAVKDKLTFDFEVEFNNKVYPFDMTIDEYFMKWFGFARVAILILFDIGMIYAIRQWFGGAS